MNPELTIRHHKEDVRLEIDELAPLAWLAHALETSALWFFGRSSFSIIAHRLNDFGPIPRFMVMADRNQRPGPLQWSGFTEIGALKEAFPHRLVKPWNDANMTGACTMVQMWNLKPECLLITLAYAFADTAVNFFKRGAHRVRGQWSHTTCQTMADISLTQEQLASFADDRDYQATEHVGSLPRMKL